jgi:hypothetical protein
MKELNGPEPLEVSTKSAGKDGWAIIDFVLMIDTILTTFFRLPINAMTNLLSIKREAATQREETETSQYHTSSPKEFRHTHGKARQKIVTGNCVFLVKHLGVAKVFVNCDVAGDGIDQPHHAATGA